MLDDKTFNRTSLELKQLITTSDISQNLSDVNRYQRYVVLCS